MGSCAGHYILGVGALLNMKKKRSSTGWAQVLAASAQFRGLIVRSPRADSEFYTILEPPPPGPHMGGCQNDGPFLGTLTIRCRTMKGTIILTTAHMYAQPLSNRPSPLVYAYCPNTKLQHGGTKSAPMPTFCPNNVRDLKISKSGLGDMLY